MRRVLICRTGAFGDVCMALPTVHALTRHCDVFWLIRRGNAPLLKLFPQVDCREIAVDFLPFGEFPPLAIDEVRAGHFDALIDLSNWDNVAALSRTLTSIPLRAIAYDDTRRMWRQRLRDSLPWTRPFNRVVTLRGRVHRTEKWRRLLEQSLGVRLTLEWPLRPLRKVSTPIKIFIHPHASKAAKQWPVGNFVAALEPISREHPLECLINEGTAAELPAVQALEHGLQRAGIPAARVVFDPTFVRLRDALEAVHLALGPDSGPLQLASILGTPTIVLYGPTDPAEVAPCFRSVAVTPSGGRRSIAAVTPAAVSAALRAWAS